MSTLVREWNDKELIAWVSGRVLSGMDRACQFAAGQAKGKAPVARGVLRDEIDYRVATEGNDVVGYVGVKKGKGDRDAFYGIFIEAGTVKAQASPFLRPAVFGNADQIVKLIAEG